MVESCIAEASNNITVEIMTIINIILDELSDSSNSEGLWYYNLSFCVISLLPAACLPTSQDKTRLYHEFTGASIVDA